ncbi:MAG: hypothetical protein KGL95_14550 [Patescibacteria group bacterium]|nr:hypothetical protein [Patescibacteria group bacterium]
MITVPEATKKIIERSRYLSESMSKGLLNYSALARYIRPEIEEILFKDVSESSIIMALKRLEPYFKPKFKAIDVFKSTPEMIVRSNLEEITLTNTMEVTNNLSKIYTTYASKPKYFFTLTEGVSETTIIASEEVFDEIRKLFTKEIVLSSYKNLSSITIRMPKEVMETPGIFYFFLKSLAWEGINIMEVVSTNLELTLILEDKEVNRAFAILKSLFTH